MHRPTPLLAAAVLGAATILALAAPMAASADADISPARAAPGSAADIVLSVPTESPTASTTVVELRLPTASPLTSVRWVPVAGWSVQTTREKLPKPVTEGSVTITEAVTRVTWTATGGGIPPGAIARFGLTVGPIPEVGVLRMPIRQTYSDGSSVDWNGRSADSDKASPRLYVTDPPPTEEGGSADAATATVATPPAAAGAAPDLLARILGLTGLAFGAAGVVVAVLALRRRGGSGA